MMADKSLEEYLENDWLVYTRDEENVNSIIERLKRDLSLHVRFYGNYCFVANLKASYFLKDYTKVELLTGLKALNYSGDIKLIPVEYGNSLLTQLRLKDSLVNGSDDTNVFHQLDSDKFKLEFNFTTYDLNDEFLNGKLDGLNKFLCTLREQVNN